VENRVLCWALLRAILAERGLTIVERILTDGPVIWILARDSSERGILWASVVCTLISVVVYIAVVFVSDVAYKRGVDVTGLETLRQLEYAVLEPRQWFKRLIRWMLQSRRLIFWIGSWFYLDPDYVTLLLRKKEEGYAAAFLKITLPSVFLSVVVWVALWWAAVQGFWWAVWVLEWVL